MQLQLSYIDTFQYFGPYGITVDVSEKFKEALQAAGTLDELSDALGAFLFGGEFLKQMEDAWNKPALTDEECGLCCDQDPSALLFSIRHWFERSLSHVSINVYVATEKCTHDTTVYSVHEEICDELEDQYLSISLLHDMEANPQLKQTYRVLTEEEQKEQREQEAYLDSLWDD